MEILSEYNFIPHDELMARKEMFRGAKSPDMVKSYVSQIQLAMEYKTLLPNELQRLPEHLRTRVELWKNRF